MMRNSHNVESTQGNVGIIFQHLPTELHPEPYRTEFQDWTKHGFIAAANYAATYFDRDNAHEYMRSVELVWNGNVVARYHTTKEQPAYLRANLTLCTCDKNNTWGIHSVSAHGKQSQ